MSFRFTSSPFFGVENSPFTKVRPSCKSTPLLDYGNLMNIVDVTFPSQKEHNNTFKTTMSVVNKTCLTPCAM